MVGEADENGNITTQRSFDVYGGVRSTWSASGESPTRNRFCGSLGHVQDDENGGLIYMRARYMDPVTGRFISEDSGHNGGNWYAYCDGNPSNKVDSDGKVSRFWAGWDTSWYGAGLTATLSALLLVWLSQRVSDVGCKAMLVTVASATTAIALADYGVATAGMDNANFKMACMGVMGWAVSACAVAMQAAGPSLNSLAGVAVAAAVVETCMLAGTIVGDDAEASMN